VSKTAYQSAVYQRRYAVKVKNLSDDAVVALACGQNVDKEYIRQRQIAFRKYKTRVQRELKMLKYRKKNNER